MSDLLNFFCCSRLKNFMTTRSPSKTKPEILIPPPYSSSDLSNSENKPPSFNDNGNSSIKSLLEKTKKKDISELFDELKTSLNDVSNSNQHIKKQYLRNWSQTEDALLLSLYKKYGGKWDLIAIKMGKTANQCSHHFRKIKPEEMKIRRLWAKEEDDKLAKLVDMHGKDWNAIAREMPERNRKQIRDRYNNTLDPKFKKNDWTFQEDLKLIQIYKKYGPKWALISSIFEGRSETMIKNRYNNHLKKKVGESFSETNNHECSGQETAGNKESPLNSNVIVKMEEETKSPNQDLSTYLEGLNSILNPNLLCSIGNQWGKNQNKNQFSRNSAIQTKREKDSISFYPHEIKASSGSDTFNKSPLLYESEKSVLNSLKNIYIQDEKISENEKKNMSLEYGSIEEVNEEIKKHVVHLTKFS